jgi:hypothetical protein
MMHKHFEKKFVNNNNEELTQIEELNLRLNLNSNSVNSSQLINPITGERRVRLSEITGFRNTNPIEEIVVNMFIGDDDVRSVNSENVGNDDQNLDEN